MRVSHGFASIARDQGAGLCAMHDEKAGYSPRSDTPKSDHARALCRGILRSGHFERRIVFAFQVQ